MSKVNWPFAGRGTLRINRAKGVYLYTDSGQEILDAAGGAIVANIGYGRERVVAKVAEAMGATGLRVQDPSEVRPAIERALATDGPVLVDVLTNPSELSMPPKTTFQQAQGYSLYLLKEILGGGAGGVVEDLSSNLR